MLEKMLNVSQCGSRFSYLRFVHACALSRRRVNVGRSVFKETRQKGLQN